MALKFETELDDSKFTKGLKNMASEAAALNSKLEAGMRSGAANFGVLAGGAALVASGFVGLVKSAIDYGGELRDAIDATNLQDESFQRLSFAMSQSGASQETFVKGAQTLQERMGEALSGNEEAGAAFAKLGISLSSLDGKDAGDAMLMIADATKNANDPAQALSASLALLGKAGKQMQPALKGGSDEIRRMGDEINVLTKAQINALDTAGDWMAKMGRILKGELASDVAAALQIAKVVSAKAPMEDTPHNREILASNAEVANDARMAAITDQETAEMRANREVEKDMTFILEERDKEEVARYKARAANFKKQDEEQIKYASDKERIEASELYEHRKNQYDAIEEKKKQAREAEKRHAEDMAKLARDQAKHLLEGARGRRQDQLQGEKSNLSQAVAQLASDTGSSVKAGMETPQQRHAQELQTRACHALWRKSELSMREVKASQ